MSPLASTDKVTLLRSAAAHSFTAEWTTSAPFLGLIASGAPHASRQYDDWCGPHQAIRPLRHWVCWCCTASQPFGIHPDTSDFDRDRRLLLSTIDVLGLSREGLKAVKGAAKPNPTTLFPLPGSPAGRLWSPKVGQGIYIRLADQPNRGSSDLPAHQSQKALFRMAHWHLNAAHPNLPGTLDVDLPQVSMQCATPFGRRRPIRGHLRTAASSCQGPHERVCVLTTCFQQCNEAGASTCGWRSCIAKNNVTTCVFMDSVLLRTRMVDKQGGAACF